MCAPPPNGTHAYLCRAFSASRVKRIGSNFSGLSQISGSLWTKVGFTPTGVPAGMRYPWNSNSSSARRGMEGTGGIIRSASLNAISVSSAFARSSYPSARPSPPVIARSSSRSFSCHSGFLAR